MDISLIKLWEIVKDKEACPWGHRKSNTIEWLNNNLQEFGITEERRSRKNIRNNDKDFSTLIIDTQPQTRKLRKDKQDKH